jgi:hypothetical protein
MNCPYCSRSLIKIDYYGDVLVGCLECNRWGRPGDKRLVMELLEDDLEALRASKQQPQAGRIRINSNGKIQLHGRPI